MGVQVNDVNDHKILTGRHNDHKILKGRHNRTESRSCFLGGGGGSSEGVCRVVSDNVDNSSVRECGSW